MKKDSWTVIPVMDGDDMIIELPDELLEQLGWEQGDEIVYDVRDGQCFVSNPTAEKRKNGTVKNSTKRTRRSNSRANETGSSSNE